VRVCVPAEQVAELAAVIGYEEAAAGGEGPRLAKSVTHSVTRNVAEECCWCVTVG